MDIKKRERIDARMKARREAERANPLYSIDRSKPGWSEGLTWQELLDARTYPNLNYRNL